MDLATIDIFEPRQYAVAVPHEKLAVLRREAPVFWQDLPDGDGAWYLLKHSDVAAASRDPETFSAAIGGIVLEQQTPDQAAVNRTQLLSMDPPEHTEMRQLVFNAFTPRTVDGMQAWLRERAGQIMDDAAEAGECDFVMDVAGELPLQLINQMMGVPEEDRATIATLADAIIAGGGGRDRSGEEDPGKVLGSYGYRLASERIGKGGDDLITLMTEATYQGKPLDATGFAGLFVQIAVAGNETTRSLMAGGMLALAERPEVYDALAADPSLLPGAVEEMFRWVTPVHYFRRTATRDVEVRGVTIEEGQRVALHYTSANHDEEVFGNPFDFDIRRDPNPQLAFGWGEHFCLGARLARLEVRVFFEELLARFARVEVIGEVERLASNLTNTTQRIPVRLTRR